MAEAAGDATVDEICHLTGPRPLSLRPHTISRIFSML